MQQITVRVLIVLFLAACGAAKHPLAPVPVPDVSAAEPAVRTALTEARAEFDRVVQSKPSDLDLGNAYGQLAMTYQAHNVVAASEIAYQNARTLAPKDKRWPYLLGHVYNDSGSMDDAIKAFEAAYALDPNDGPIIFSLAEVLLQHGDLDRARQLYAKLESHDDDRAAALAGLGKVALAKRDYRTAIEQFEKALELSPGSSRLRQPLASAYKAIGERAKAEANLAQYSVEGMEPAIADPVVEQMGDKGASSRALFRRGQRYIEVGRYDVAEAAFRRVTQADPKDATALAYLGFALVNLGRNDEAERTLLRSLELDDKSSLAHFSLGVLYDRGGQDERAIEQYEATLRGNPENAQARVYLADAKMRTGQAAAAADLYGKVAADAGDVGRIQLSLAMALIKARRYAQARKVLETAFAAQSRNASIGNALARLLATAPDNSVRAGARALELSKTIFESTRHPDAAQTYAMALAETRRFDDAVKLQQQIIDTLDGQAIQAVKPFLVSNLGLYKQRRPVRDGWPADDPLFKPRSTAVSLGARKNSG